MDKTTKSKLYSEMYTRLKKDPNVTGLGFPEKRSNYDFFGEISGNPFVFSLKQKADMLMLRVDIKVEGAKEESLESTAERITDNSDYKAEAYDGKIVIQRVVTFTGTADAEAADIIRKETSDFIGYIETSNDIPRVQKEIKTPVVDAEDPFDIGSPESDDIEVPVPEADSSESMEADTFDGFSEEDSMDTEGFEDAGFSESEDNETEDPEMKEDTFEMEESYEGQIPSSSEETSIPEKVELDVDSIDRLYERLDKAFDERRNQLNDFEKELDQRDAVIKENTEKLQVLVAGVNEELKACKAYLKKDKEVIATQKKRLVLEQQAINKRSQDVDKRYESVQAAIEMLESIDITKKDGLADLTAVVSELKSANKEKDETIAGLKEKESSYEKTIHSLKKENLRLSSEEKVDPKLLAAAKNEIETLKGQLKEQEEKGNSSDELEECYGEIRKLNASLVDQTEQLKAANEENERLKAEAEKSKEPDLKEVAENIKKDLAEVGIAVEAIPGMEEIVLKGEKDNCVFCVNVEAGVMYAEKAVRKGAKYQKDIEKWNDENIRESYSFSDKKVKCKYVYIKAAQSAMEILKRFATLK